MFDTDFNTILEKIDTVNPVDYGRTRNYHDGDVTRLSPYISRGVISTRDVFSSIVRRGFDPFKVRKFVQELAWRDYFQQVWIARDIDRDVKRNQPGVENSSIPKAIVEAETGIDAVDDAVRELYTTGYVHNHARMYIASLACNLGRSHWKLPAKWFYFHLLDADWASNALSWQWVAGAFSYKKYFANQANLNKFFGTDQRGTFLDVEYKEFPPAKIPEVFSELTVPELRTTLPAQIEIDLDPKLPTAIYNSYNLDPRWKVDIRANRILLLEPEHFAKYPVSDKTLDFVLKLAANIEGIQVFTGAFKELVDKYSMNRVFFKEHPTTKHYSGVQESRDWLFPEVKGYFSSFFSYWKQCENLLRGQRSLF